MPLSAILIHRLILKVAFGKPFVVATTTAGNKYAIFKNFGFNFSAFGEYYLALYKNGAVFRKKWNYSQPMKQAWGKDFGTIVKNCPRKK